LPWNFSKALKNKKCFQISSVLRYSKAKLGLVGKIVVKNFAFFELKFLNNFGMALEDILKKIKKETDNQIRKIWEKTDEEMRKIEEKYEEEINKKRSKILELAKEEAKKKIRHSQIKLSLETKNLILAKKQEILEEVYQEVLDKFSKLQDKDYLRLILNLIKICPENGEIIPARGREEITQKAILASKRKYILAKRSLPIKGGFIFSSKDLEIDNSFETLIKTIREKTEIKIAKILFG